VAAAVGASQDQLRAQLEQQFQSNVGRGVAEASESLRA
jgi:hypothetical protein